MIKHFCDNCNSEMVEYEKLYISRTRYKEKGPVEDVDWEICPSCQKNLESLQDFAVKGMTNDRLHKSGANNN